MICLYQYLVSFFFFQAEDGIRDLTVTGVQTCALPICFGLDFPGIELAEGQPFVDDRPWLSASHPEALAPMAVALTRHAFGDDLAAALAAVLQPDAQRERATRAALQDRRIPATRNSVRSEE